jgi:Ca2+-binding EF-hand superfamily protein
LEQQHRDLLTRYDLNHNGRIDPEEREAALGDPAFIRSELDAIDANHNGLLDPEELACFDPDNNKILEPNEQTGIDIAWHLLAERLLKKFDADGNGTLDQSEFDNLQANLKTKVAFMTEPSRNSLAWDDNHDGVIDSGELESSLKQQLRSALRPRGAAAAAFFRQLTADPNTAIDPRHMFKAEVEFYWQNSASPANETPAPNPHGHVP